MLTVINIELEADNGMRWITVHDVVRVEADDKKVKIFLTGGSIATDTKLLQYYELLLCHLHFTRVHRSHIVNLEHVGSLTNDNIIIMKTGLPVPLAKNRRAELLLRKKEYTLQPPVNDIIEKVVRPKRIKPA